VLDVAAPVSGEAASFAAESPRAGDVRAASRAAGLLLAAGIAVGSGNLLFNVLVARSGGADTYGAFGALAAVAAVAGVLATGVQYAVARRVAVTHATGAERLRLAGRAIGPWAVLVVPLLALAPAVAGYLKLPSTAPAVLGVCLLAITLASAVPIGILVGTRSFVLIACANLAMVVLRIALGVPLMRVLEPTSGAVLASILPVIVVAGALGLRLAADHRPDGSLLPIQRSSAGVGSESVAGAAYAAVLWGLWILPLLLARHHMRGETAGRFAAAQALVSGLLFLSSSVTTAFFPAIAARSSRRLVLAGLATTAAVGATGVVLIGALGPTVIVHAFGGTFASDAGVLPALGVSAAIVAVASYLIWAARALREASRVTLWFVGAALIVEVLDGWLVSLSAVQLALVPALSIVVAALGCTAALTFRRLLASRSRRGTA